MKKAIRLVVAIAIYIYFFGIVVSATYFNWQYAKDNGFLKWILFGEIVPTAKAIVWPYFLFEAQSDDKLGHLRSDSNKVGISSFGNQETLGPHITSWLKSGSYYIEANQIATRIGLGHQPNGEEFAKMRHLLNQAVTAAHAVEPAKLNEVYPSLGDHFRDDYLSGIKHRLDAIENPQQGKMQKADALLKRWDDWYFTHQANIKRRLQDLNFPVE